MTLSKMPRGRRNEPEVGKEGGARHGERERERRGVGERGRERETEPSRGCSVQGREWRKEGETREGRREGENERKDGASYRRLGT